MDFQEDAEATLTKLIQDVISMTENKPEIPKETTDGDNNDFTNDEKNSREIVKEVLNKGEKPTTSGETCTKDDSVPVGASKSKRRRVVKFNLEPLVIFINNDDVKESPKPVKKRVSNGKIAKALYEGEEPKTFEEATIKDDSAPVVKVKPQRKPILKVNFKRPVTSHNDGGEESTKPVNKKGSKSKITDKAILMIQEDPKASKKDGKRDANLESNKEMRKHLNKTILVTEEKPKTTKKRKNCDANLESKKKERQQTDKAILMTQEDSKASKKNGKCDANLDCNKKKRKHTDKAILMTQEDPKASKKNGKCDANLDCNKKKRKHEEKSILFAEEKPKTIKKIKKCDVILKSTKKRRKQVEEPLNEEKEPKTSGESNIRDGYVRKLRQRRTVEKPLNENEEPKTSGESPVREAYAPAVKRLRQRKYVQEPLIEEEKPTISGESNIRNDYVRKLRQYRTFQVDKTILMSQAKPDTTRKQGKSDVNVESNKKKRKRVEDVLSEKDKSKASADTAIRVPVVEKRRKINRAANTQDTPETPLVIEENNIPDERRGIWCNLFGFISGTAKFLGNLFLRRIPSPFRRRTSM